MLSGVGGASAPAGEGGAVMRRFLVVAVLVVSFGAALGIAPAGAGPGELTVVLSCDKGVTATVEATWVVNNTGGFGPMSCTPASKTVRLVASIPPETGFVVTQFDVSTDPAGCANPD